MSLIGRICMITGSSRGIGRGLAEVFATEGATVIVHGRDKQKVEDFVKTLATPQSQKHFGVAGDLTQEEDRKKCADEIKSKVSHLDVLIHNAAVLGKIELLETLPISDFRQTYVTNVEAPLAFNQLLLPLVKKATNSSIKIQGLSTWGGYAISKFGLEGLAWVMAQELEGDKIKVNVVNPGTVRTEMRAAAAPSEDPMILPTAPEIAPIFVYLGRSDIPFVTGKSFTAQDYLKKSQAEVQQLQQ